MARLTLSGLRAPGQESRVPGSVPAEARPTLKPIGRAITATEEEIAANPRARSARLRTAERC